MEKWLDVPKKNSLTPEGCGIPVILEKEHSKPIIYSGKIA